VTSNSILDSKISDKDAWYQGITDLEEGLTDSPFDMVDSSEEIGFFVPFSKNVGHGFTFKVLTRDTKKVLSRSRVRLKSTGTNLRLEPQDLVDENVEEQKEILENEIVQEAK
jgi:hypothetical protein